MRSRKVVLTIAVALALLGGGQALSAETVGSAISQAYHPGRLDGTTVVASTDAAYDGEMLSLAMHYVGRDAIEPTVRADKDGRVFFAAGAYDLVEAAGGVYIRTKILRSTDGGGTWTSVERHLPAGPSGGGETKLPPASFDPYVYVDETTDRVFDLDLNAVTCSVLNFSDDGGDNWTTNPVACGQFVNDHQTIVTGPPPPGLPTVGYPNVVYYCFNRVADSNCSRSLDGGVTFSPAGSPAFLGFDPAAGGLCGGLHGHIETDTKGRLYLPKGHCGAPWLAVSEDGGTTWRRTKVSDMPVDQAHLSVATDAADNVYMTWWDSERRLPWLAISRDAGRTFGAPMMIAPPGVAEVNFPTVTAGDEGKIALTFMGTADGDRADKTRPWNAYVVATENALADTPLLLSATANPVSDPMHRGDCYGRCALLHDFLDISLSPADGTIWAANSDMCTTLQKCNTVAAPGNGSGGDGVSSDYEGVAIHQVGGPVLSTVSPD